MGSPTIEFITSPSVSVTNGSDIVTVTGSVDTYHVYNGTVVFIGNNPPVEAISGTIIDGSGNSTIKLAKPWGLVTVTNEPLVAFNSNEGLPEAIRRARQIGDLTLSLMNNFEELLNSTDPTITIDINGVPTNFVPYKYLENKLNSLIVSAEANEAIKKADFERNRLNELNNFPVAGFSVIDFDSSFEFQQVDGWQNKFRVKSGKVRIDGVWHNYDDTDIVLSDAPNGLQNKDLTTADFVDLDAAIVAGGASLSQSYLNQRHFVYIEQEDIAAPNGLSMSYIQDPKNNIYSVSGVLRQRTISFVAKRILESVEIKTGQLWTNSVNCMTSLGWSLSADVYGQWEKDGKKAAGLTVVQSRNQGAYNPTWNPNGGAIKGTNNGLTNGATSLDDAFTGQSGGNISSGSKSIKGFYDAIYPSDVESSKMSVMELPPKVIREKSKRSAIAGKVRGFEGVPFTYATTGIDIVAQPFNVVINDRSVRMYRTSITLTSGDWDIGNVEGTFLNCALVFGGTTYIGVGVLSGNNSNVDLMFDTTGLVPPLGNGDTIEVLVFTAYKATIKHSQANATWTDIIGSPENIADTFPDGAEGRWIPVIPDGTNDYFPLNRKGINSGKASREYTNDNGSSWTSHTLLAFDDIGNITQFDNMPVTQVMLYHYETQAHFTESATLGEELDKSTSVMAINNHNDAILVDSISGIIPTSTDSNEELTITKVIDGVVSHTDESIAADVIFADQIESKDGVSKFVFNIDDNGVINGTKVQSFETQYFLLDW